MQKMQQHWQKHPITRPVHESPSRWMASVKRRISVTGFAYSSVIVSIDSRSGVSMARVKCCADLFDGDVANRRHTADRKLHLGHRFCVFVCDRVYRVERRGEHEVVRDIEDDEEHDGQTEVCRSCHGPVLLRPVVQSSSVQPLVRDISPYQKQTQADERSEV